MKEEALYDVLRYPVVSEKTTVLSQFNKYVFRVCPKTDKAEVKKAVESIFSVKVMKINSIAVKGKVKRFKGVKGVRSDSKKVIVTLAEGNSIDLSAGIK